jgi:uncharacterized protein YceK
MRYLLLLTVLVSGCTTVSNKYYEPQVNYSDQLTVVHCGHEYKVLRLNLSADVVLEMIGPQHLFFRIGKGSSVKFASDVMNFTNKDEGVSSKVTINKIVTGDFPGRAAIYEKHYKIPKIEFEPLDELLGTGNYEQMEIRLGEYSAFKGKKDIFRVYYDSKLPQHKDTEIGHKPTIIVDLPQMYIQGNPIKIKPIEFKWVEKSSLSLQCLQ